MRVGFRQLTSDNDVGKGGECSTQRRIKALSQKINIITAMSSDGDVWIALTTCNTDSDVLMMFMTQLASVLTKE